MINKTVENIEIDWYRNELHLHWVFLELSMKGISQKCQISASFYIVTFVLCNSFLWSKFEIIEFLKQGLQLYSIVAKDLPFSTLKNSINSKNYMSWYCFG